MAGEPFCSRRGGRSISPGSVPDPSRMGRRQRPLSVIVTSTATHGRIARYSMGQVGFGLPSETRRTTGAGAGRAERSSSLPVASGQRALWSAPSRAGRARLGCQGAGGSLLPTCMRVRVRPEGVLTTVRRFAVLRPDQTRRMRIWFGPDLLAAFKRRAVAGGLIATVRFGQ
jgi:hypothetical protein